MQYPVTLTPDAANGGFVLRFPDIPEAITQGETEDQALALAQDAFRTALEFYFEDKRPLPAPSRPRPGQHLFVVAPSIAAKALLRNEMLRQKIRPAELARRLNTSPQEVNRLTNLRHSTRIDSIAVALRALGRQLEVRLV